MSAAVLSKLFALFAIAALGWIAGKLKWLGPAERDPARTLSNAAFMLFVPALLFRTTARLDLTTLPWNTVFAFFGPVLMVALLVYGWERSRQRRGSGAPTAGPSIRAISVGFGNTVQIGIPLSAALFGEAGLAIHIGIVSLHALTLLTVLTALVETDLARARHDDRAGANRVVGTLLATVRNTVVHPVVLPVLAGLAFNLAGLSVPPQLDEILLTLGLAVVPMCLVLIGLSLAYYGLHGAARAAIVIALLKLLVLPAVVLGVAHGLFGLSGLPLAVVVMMAALPVGSNALIFAQRYDAMQSQTSAAIVFSTVGFLATGPLWLAVLHALG